MTRGIGIVEERLATSVIVKNAVVSEGKALSPRVTYVQAANSFNDKNHGGVSINTSGASMDKQQGALQHHFLRKQLV